MNETNSQGFTKEQLKKIQEHFYPQCVIKSTDSPDDTYKCLWGFSYRLGSYTVKESVLEEARKLFIDESSYMLHIYRNNGLVPANQLSHKCVGLDAAKKKAAQVIQEQGVGRVVIYKAIGEVGPVEVPVNYTEY